MQIYEQNGQIYLDESDEYTIQAQDLGSWVTVPMLSPFLFLLEHHTWAVKGVQHSTDTSLISASSNVNTSSYIQDNGCDIGSQGFGYWYTASDPLAIRMNFGYVSSINDDINSGFNIGPNPSKGIFTVENSHSESVVFIVRNVLGQISFKGNLNAISNSTFDLSHLESGIYTIEFDGKQKSIIKN